MLSERLRKQKERRNNKEGVRVNYNWRGVFVNSSSTRALITPLNLNLPSMLPSEGRISGLLNECDIREGEREKKKHNDKCNTYLSDD